MLLPIPDEEEDIQEQEEQHNTQQKAQEEASISLDPTPELEPEIVSEESAEESEPEYNAGAEPLALNKLPTYQDIIACYKDQKGDCSLGRAIEKKNSEKVVRKIAHEIEAIWTSLRPNIPIIRIE